jgi:hypothetical protein
VNFFKDVERLNRGIFYDIIPYELRTSKNILSRYILGEAKQERQTFDRDEV